MKTAMMKHNAVLLVGLLVGTWNVEMRKANSAPIPETMVRIPAGEFMMGDVTGDTLSNNDEYPVHPVYVSDFYIDKYEVSKALWDSVYDWATNHGYSLISRRFDKPSNHPMSGITWYDAIKWCNARSEMGGIRPAYFTDINLSVVYRTGVTTPYVSWATGFRLPTEAEWEKAARGGQQGRRFPWSESDLITHNLANYDSNYRYSYDVSITRGYHPDYDEGDTPYTSPVGSFPANSYGLYDCAGNVSEWCWDWVLYDYSKNFGYVDPKGSPSGFSRSLRGGTYRSRASSIRVSARGNFNPTYPYDWHGFRVAMTKIPEWCIATTPQPVYNDCPIKEDGKNSLIVVVHGRIEKKGGQTEPPNPDWVDEMTNAITSYLSAKGSHD